jgi:hypothetical protein
MALTGITFRASHRYCEVIFLLSQPLAKATGAPSLAMNATSASRGQPEAMINFINEMTDFCE